MRKMSALVALAAVLALVGCSSNDKANEPPAGDETSPTATDTTPTDDGQQAAAAIVATLEQASPFSAAGPAFDASAMQGKQIGVVVSGETAQFVQDFEAGVKAAADVLGASVNFQDCGYDSTKASQQIEQFVGAGVGAIILQSVDSSAVAAAIGTAKAAGIPVIESTSRDAGEVPADLAEIGVSAIASFCYSCAGEQMAAFAVASTDGVVNALVYNVPGVVVSTQMVDGFRNELARLQPAGQVTVVDAPAADWQANLGTLTTSNLQTNPDLNTLVPVFDSMVDLIEPVLTAAASDVAIVTYNATAPALTLLKEGRYVTGNVGSSPLWLGWAAVDQAARLLAGEAPIGDIMIPARIFTANNISSIDLTASQQTWYSEADLETEYRALWQM